MLITASMLRNPSGSLTVYYFMTYALVFTQGHKHCAVAFKKREVIV